MRVCALGQIQKTKSGTTLISCGCFKVSWDVVHFISKHSFEPFSGVPASTGDSRRMQPSARIILGPVEQKERFGSRPELNRSATEM